MDGDLAKLRHSNNSVASSAHRWIIVHPKNTSVSDFILRPRASGGAREDQHPRRFRWKLSEH